MRILRDDARPLAVDSFAISDNVGQEIALPAARVAARARAAGEVESCRITLPYDGGWMRLMAAALPGLGVFGYKEFHLSSGNTVRYAVHMFSLSDGRPLGVVDAALVTTLRTAASAAVAAGWFFGAGVSVRLGVIGSGAEALAGVRALNAVLSLADVRVTSRNAANREKFAATIAEELGLAAQPVESTAHATAHADIVYVATNSGGKVVVGLDELRLVPFVASIGSTLPAQRELDDEVLAAAANLIIDTPDVLEESGDAIAAAEHGLVAGAATLLGDMPSREWGRGDGLTVYKSIGSPEQDLVLAKAILDAAAVHGFGRAIDPLSTIKQNL